LQARFAEATVAPRAAPCAPHEPPAKLVARGRHVFKQPGWGTIELRATPAGKRLLHRGKRVTLTLRATFKPAGRGRAIVQTRRLVLRR